MEIKLLPCPFCKSTDLAVDDIDYRFNEDIPEEFGDRIYYAVVCFNCNARGSEKESEILSKLTWNRGSGNG
ncbi:hypothetical protein RHO12_03400 [Orbus sturtevantii]|uniref:Lar family restriction alleviation protein n=1 Tax=Orbus sturtevantii TaxID=3074109 RepID=UPI00370D00FE